MDDLFWLSASQMRRIKPYFPRSRGKPRVDDRRVPSGILHVLRNGLRWRDAPAAYGPRKTLHNRFARWSRRGASSGSFAALAGAPGEPERIMIDATHLKARRTAASLRRKGALAAASAAPRAG